VSTAITTKIAPPTLPGQTGRSFSKRQKAAIVVRLLLSGNSGFSLVDLPETTIAELTRQMTTLRYIDHQTMHSVAQEFLGELNGIGLSFPTALDSALEMLDGAISPETATRLRDQAGVQETRDPWDVIGVTDPDLLRSVLQEESVEVAAVLLSKLKVTLAAELLGQIPGERARRIAFAVSLTGNISPDVVQKIGVSLAAQLSKQPVRAFSDDPVDRVGAILNFSPAITRDEVLAGLDQSDAGFADQVRKAIFTFAHIPTRIYPADIPKITREIDPEMLIMALAAASGKEAEASEFILSNMSQRMSGQLREDMEALGDIKEKDGEAAMTAVIIQIRELETAGEISLVAEEE